MEEFNILTHIGNKMLKGNILAHRGLWYKQYEKNTTIALQRALEFGFGIETDLRDRLGEIVISHDPVINNYELTFEDFLNFIHRNSFSSRIALNIKADGLHTILKSELFKHADFLTNAYLFDMSFPDMFGYINAELPVYSRISEHESSMPGQLLIEGVWVDSFAGKYPQVETALSFLEAGIRVGFVSPELHGRPYEQVWKKIKIFRLHEFEKFELCTDFPEYAFDYFMRN